MGNKSSSQKQAEARRREQELAKKKKQRLIIEIVSIVVIAAIAVTLIVVAGKSAGGSGSGTETTETVTTSAKEPVYNLMSAEDYTITNEVTDYVVLNVSYTAKDGTPHTGDIVVELDTAGNAPLTVANFKKLVSEKFYDGLTFHRVREGFMIQGGDPKGDGTGGSSDTIKGEFTANGVNNTIKHERGVISMARGKANNTASSQFFIVHQTSDWLDGNYAAFGHVVFGMTTVDGIAAIQVKYNASEKANSIPVYPVVINYAKFVTPTVPEN